MKWMLANNPCGMAQNLFTHTKQYIHLIIFFLFLTRTCTHIYPIGNWNIMDYVKKKEKKK